MPFDMIRPAAWLISSGLFRQAEEHIFKVGLGGADIADIAAGCLYRLQNINCITGRRIKTNR